MKRRLFDLLACPLCGGDFSAAILQEERGPAFQPEAIPCQRRCLWQEGTSGRARLGEKAGLEECARCFRSEIIEGLVFCPGGHEFPISRGVLRAVSSTHGEPHSSSLRHQRVKATFDREWRMVNAEKEIYGHSPRTEVEDFRRRMCVDEDYIKGKLVLDVGCGIGRLADRLSKKDTEVVGVELSDGVDQAWEMSRQNPRVHFIQGNLYILPLRPRVFDYVYSKGVLQYVSNPREAFGRISRMVRPGGGLSVTLYPPLPRVFSLVNRAVRAVTLRLPLSLVNCLSLTAVPFLSPVWKCSGVENRRIPWRDRGHMIFNWLAADYQNFYSTEEVLSWYHEEGFAGFRTSSLPVGVFGEWEGCEG